MSSSLQMNITRHEYTVKTWQKALYFLLGLGFFAVGILMFAAATAESNRILGPGISLLFCAAGLYTLSWGLRSRLVIDGDRVEVRGAFQERSASIGDIEGIRTISTRNGSYKQLCLRDGRGNLTLSNSLATDDDYNAWLEQFTDLDARDRDALLEKISSEAELGSTPEERLNALSRAKGWSIGTAVVAGAAAAGLIFGNAAMQPPCAVVLAFTPFAVAYLAHKSPLLFAVFKSKADPRADFSFALIAATVGAMIRGFNMNFVSYQQLLPAAGGAAVLYLAALYGAARKSSNAAGSVFTLLFFGAMYGYGFAVVADTIADTAPGQVFSTEVLSKHTSSGRSTSYYLDLAPWGPMESQNKLKVSSGAYRKAFIGEEVCLALHPGSLQAQWYRPVECESQTAPPHEQ